MNQPKQVQHPSGSEVPPDFLAKMRQLLGEADYQEFLNTYSVTARSGLRVNTLKISIPDFISKSPFELSPVGPHEPAGFLLMDGSRPGVHPYHAAGLYYLQEPSAMVVASLIAPEPGEWVLDLAAAPGGKATHLATLMGDEGLLVANDVSRGRVQDLAQNLERWGVRNTLITSNTPEQLEAAFGAVFDRVLLDAPCSGEGMFRRIGGFSWSEETVAACARRQSVLIDTAANLVRPGGTLAYATCTFSPEENEEVIGRFLARRSEFELIRLPLFEGFAAGRPDWLSEEFAAGFRASDLTRAIRLYPHRFPGEGHFIALLCRTNGEGIHMSQETITHEPPSRADRELWERFAGDNLRADLPERRLRRLGKRLYLFPEMLIPSTVNAIRPGLLLGELRQGYFKPAHALALALSPEEALQSVTWAAESAEISAYLSGQGSRLSGPDGWVLVTVDGFPIGWGKRVRGYLKNHYPRGLRRPAK